MGARHGGRGTLVALVAVSAIAVLGVLLAGPLRVSSAAWSGPPLPSATHTMLVIPQRAKALDPTSGPGFGLGAVILGAIVLLILTLVVVLVVALVRRIMARPEVVTTGSLEEMDDDGRGAPTVAAPAMRRGLVEALARLDRAEGSTSDAVVAAWLTLEDTAREAGVPREPAETPSEYAARIVQRYDADRSAADELRALYERVRFGGQPADADSVAGARRCLERLLDSWTASPERRAGESVGR